MAWFKFIYMFIIEQCIDGISIEWHLLTCLSSNNVSESTMEISLKMSSQYLYVLTIFWHGCILWGLYSVNQCLYMCVLIWFVSGTKWIFYKGRTPIILENRKKCSYYPWVWRNYLGWFKEVWSQHQGTHVTMHTTMGSQWL